MNCKNTAYPVGYYYKIKTFFINDNEIVAIFSTPRNRETQDKRDQLSKKQNTEQKTQKKPFSTQKEQPFQKNESKTMSNKQRLNFLYKKAI